MFQRMHPWSGTGGDYWDCRISESFIKNSFDLPCHRDVKIKITGLSYDIDYIDWLRENYPEYEDFINFWQCGLNYPGKSPEFFQFFGAMMLR